MIAVNMHVDLDRKTERARSCQEYCFIFWKYIQGMAYTIFIANKLLRHNLRDDSNASDDAELIAQNIFFVKLETKSHFD